MNNNLNAILAAMISPERLEPPCDFDEEKEHQFILSMIFEVCDDIRKKDSRTQYKRAFDAMYEHIQENIELYRIEDDGGI